MPELPEVEHFRRVLARHARGQRIVRIEVLDPGVLRNVTRRRLRHALEGRRFLTPRRQGKWLLARTQVETASSCGHPRFTTPRQPRKPAPVPVV